MPKLIEIHFDKAILSNHGLPDISYRIPAESLDSALSNDGVLPFAEMLFGLQEHSRNGQAAWTDLESAMSRLVELLAPLDDRPILSAAGERWWLEVGEVNLDAPLVTIQRGDNLIAAMTNRGDGRLRVATFRPLDAKSASYLVGLGLIPHPKHGVCMRENNWEYALDCSAGTGNAYADLRGEAHLSFWEKGIGIMHDGTIDPIWRTMKDMKPLPAIHAVVELGIHFSFSQNEEEEQQNNNIAPEPSPIPAWNRKRQQKRTVQGRFLGCLVGGAVGDALGAPVEFMRRSEILQQFGPKGITSYAPAYSTLGAITDDTQMTLFTAEGLLRSYVRYRNKGITSISGCVAHAYVRWLSTQGVYPAKEINCDADGWLFQQQELHSRRAPGNTCLSALQAMRSLGEPAQNNSKGCGGVMRVAPVGLVASRMKWEAEKTFEHGAELAALTHGHPTGILPGGVLAILIHALADGASLPEGLLVAKNILKIKNNYEETFSAIELAEKLARSSMAPHEAIARIGQGWIAEEALAISLYCSLTAKKFKEAVILSVNHDGDSDSTGAITGNIMGAALGAKCIPPQWMAHLELFDVITEIANDLYAFPFWDIGEYSANEALNEQIWNKYPGW